MNSYCLSKESVERILDYSLNRDITKLEDIESDYIERAIEWQVKVVSSNRFVSEILEKKNKKNENCLDSLENYYLLPSEMYLHIDELTRDFIEFISRYKLPKGDFEEDLIELLDDYHGKVYY